MNYSKYSDDDLIESYSTMMDYSGKAEADILLEIEKRGGIESFLNRIENKKTNSKEVNRISKEVYSLSKEYSDLEFIRPFISSDILDEKELNELIEIRFKEHQAILADRKIDSNTIIGSLVGILAGSFLGFIFLIATAYCLKRLMYFSIVGAYIICYYTLKLITKQSRNNPVIFVASFISTIIAVILAFVCGSYLFAISSN